MPAASRPAGRRPRRGASAASMLGQPELAGDLGAGAAADRLVEDLGELADVGVRMLGRRAGSRPRGRGRCRRGTRAGRRTWCASRPRMSERVPAGAALRGRPRTAPPARRWLGVMGSVLSALLRPPARVPDEVDGIAHGLDLGRLLLAHPDLVAVLELHHELVEVERVGVEILAEPASRAGSGRARPRARCSGGRGPAS